MPLHHPDATWLDEEHLVEARRCPCLPSVSTKLDHPVCQIRQSNFCSFEHGLSVPVHFMCEHILVTLLGNRLLQARQT
jgi:hypothetical protein